MRCDKSPAEIFTAVALMSWIGRMARLAIHQPPARPSSNTPPPTAMSVSATNRRSFNSAAMERPTTIHVISSANGGANGDRRNDASRKSPCVTVGSGPRESTRNEGMRLISLKEIRELKGASPGALAERANSVPFRLIT